MAALLFPAGKRAMLIAAVPVSMGSVPLVSPLSVAVLNSELHWVVGVPTVVRNGVDAVCEDVCERVDGGLGNDAVALIGNAVAWVR